MPQGTPVSTPPRLGLRLLAAFEAAKGLLVLLAGTGIFLMVHRDIQAAAERFILHLHLNPANRYPRIFLHIAEQATSARLRWLAVGALVYALFRLVEAFGLWRDRRWAEWLGVISGAVYVPFEIRAMVHRPGLEPAVALLINAGAVAYLAGRLRDGHGAGAPALPR